MVALFAAWLHDYGYFPEDASDLDDCMVHYKNDKSIKYSDFISLLAGIEFILPRFRRQLRWCKAIQAGRAIAHKCKHTTPCTRALAHLLAAQLIALRHARLALGLVLQQCMGWRPSELLQLLTSGVLMPEDMVSADRKVCIISLGTKAGTKAKRVQTSTLTRGYLIGLVLWLKFHTPPDSRLFPYSYSQYRALLKKVVHSHLGLRDLDITPHSPRSGFATECAIEGIPTQRAMELGRWRVESSYRTYVDVCMSANIAVSLHIAGLTPSLAFCSDPSNFIQMFEGAASFQRASDGSSHDAGDGNLSQPGGPGVLAAVERRRGPRRSSSRLVSDPDEEPQSDSTDSSVDGQARCGRTVCFADESVALGPSGHRAERDPEADGGDHSGARRGRGCGSTRGGWSAGRSRS